MPDQQLAVGMFGAEVANLQHKLLQHGFDIPAAEIEREFFGPATREAVRRSQIQHGLTPTGVLDEPTAAAISASVAAGKSPIPVPLPGVPGSLPGNGPQAPLATPSPPEPSGSESSARPTGAQSKTGAPPSVSAAGIGAAARNRPSADVPDVLSDRSLARDLSRRYGMPVDLMTGETMTRMVEAAARAGESNSRLVDGHLLLPDGRPATGITVLVYEHTVGGTPRKAAEVTADKFGFFQAEYGERIGGAAIELRTVDVDGKEVLLSAPLFGASTHETINLVAPASVEGTVAPEFERLTHTIADRFGSMGVLANAVETADQRDLTLLADATGWDQRGLAIAAKALKLADTTSINPQALFAVGRLGAPMERQMLSMMTGEQFGHLLERAQECGLVRFEREIAPLVNQFREFALTERLAYRPAGAVSTLGQTLDAAGLDDAARKAALSAAFDERLTGAEFFDSLETAGVSPAAVEGLKLQTKLGVFTLNNAELNASVAPLVTHGNSPVALARAGYYHADAWKQQIGALAGGDTDKLESMLPPVYRPQDGGNLQPGVDAYAAEMARRIRVTYPTAVVTQMVTRDELALGPELGADKAGLLTLLDADSFDLSSTPVDLWLAANAGTLPQPLSDEATNSARVLQRTFQLTPNNAGMQVLLDSRLTSAAKIASMPREEFLRRHEHDFENAADASLVYRKAQQIHAIALNFVTDVQRIGATPTVYALHGAPPTESEIADSNQSTLIATFPTLEGLFGNLDYCECEHCRSVLSPAAYLVDLLRFLDPPDEAWDASAGGMKPYDALVLRRPDIPYIPLTCENTNTVVPYIDLVNEIMEFDVVGQLTSDSAGDTGDADSVDLMAEPAVLDPAITRAAYTELAGAHYPAELPFDLSVATARRFLVQFGAQFWEVLEAFAEPELQGISAAGMQDVFLEQLGLSPADQRVLFGTRPDPANWHELYGLAQPGQIPVELSNAKGLSRRLGVSYRDLVRLVGVRFVNPGLAALEPLRRRGVELSAALRYAGAPGYEPLDDAERADLETSLGPTGVAWLESAWSQELFGDAVLLRGLDAGCDFGQVDVIPALGTNDVVLSGFLYRLNLFVRIWRRLDWSIDELDVALAAFFPAGVEVGGQAWASAVIGLAPGEVATRLRSALIHVAHLERIRNLLAGRPSREELVSLWSTISTIGRPSLYERRFVGTQDEYFEDALGSFLQGTPESLKDHLPGVQSGTGLTAEEIHVVLGHYGMGLTGMSVDLSSVAVDMPLVALLYRHGLLARSLRIDIEDLLGLTRLLRLDPFPRAPVAPLTTLGDDLVYTQTLEFVRLAVGLDEAGGSAAVLDQVFRHRRLHDEGSTPEEFLNGLRDQLTSVGVELAELTDPARFTDELVAQKAGLVLEPNAASALSGLWIGSIEYDHARTGVPLADRLPLELNDEPGLQLSYDSVRDLEELRATGMMTPNRRAEILARHPHPVLGGILTGFTDEATSFLAEYLGADALALDVELLFGPAPGTATPEELRLRDEMRRAAFAPVLLDLLGRRLREVRAMATAASSLDLDAARSRLLLTETTVLAKPGADPPVPLLRSLMAAAATGVRASAFDGPDLTGNQIDSRVPAFRWDPTSGAANSLRLEARITPPAAGPYRFHVTQLAAGATTRITIDGLEILAGTQGTPLNEVVELEAGRLHRLRAEVDQLNGGSFRIEVEADGLPLGSLDRLQLTPTDAATEVETARQLVAKIATLADMFQLTDRELELVLSDDDAPTPVMSRLPVTPTGVVEPRLAAVHRSLLDYLAVRNGWVAGRDDLIGVMATARSSGGIVELADSLATVVSRSSDTLIDAAAAAFDRGRDAFETPGGLLRLWRLMELLRRTGLSLTDLAQIASASPDPNATRNAVRARYEEQAWRNVAKPVYDDLRRQRRNALVAFLLNKHGHDRVEQLFEWYLIDPGMEHMVVSSRIQLGISAVQLFIQRCLLNLEAEVRPTALRADHWEWMKRYRVWEANRKIFLFPENWLEPEFRDDKTHLFRELESNLLADEITDDRAEAALHGYLHGLESISRLQIVSSFWEEGAVPSDKTLHVVGRTWSQPHKWFYRRFSSEYRAWTPWEPIETDVEGDHVAVAVWQSRVHLFWLTIFERQEESDDVPRGSNVDELARDVDFDKLRPRLRYDARLAWSDYSADGWTEPVSSEVVQLPDWNGQSTSPGLSVSLEQRSVGDDYAEENRGLRRNPVHVTFPDERTIVINLNSIVRPAVPHFGDDGNTADPDGDVAVLALRSGSSPSRLLDVGRDRATEFQLLPVFPSGVGFELTSKYKGPRLVAASRRQATPLQGLSSLEGRSTGPPTGYTRSGPLAGMYTTEIRDDGSGRPRPIVSSRPILESGRTYQVIPCSNPATMRTTDGEPSEPLGGLIKPFFYQDDEHTFLIDPALQVSYDMEPEVIGPGVVVPDFGWTHEPLPCAPINPIDPSDAILKDWVKVRDELIQHIHPTSIHQVEIHGNWVTQPGTVIDFGGGLVGSGGFLGDRNLINLQLDGLGSVVSPIGRVSDFDSGSPFIVGDSGLSRAAVERMNEVRRRRPNGLMGDGFTRGRE